MTTDTILFDLDGTLLPMEMDTFMKVYFGELARSFAKGGYDADATMKAVYKGTGAMVKNDGAASNEDVFWRVFSAEMGRDMLPVKPVLERFYENEFHVARAACRHNALAQPLIARLREAGFTLVLATNPLFPAAAIESRLSWLGLTTADFDHVTTYTNSHFCKPNPAYFTEILQAVGAAPTRCLMVGNDVADDGGAEAAGIPLYFVTDDLMNDDGEVVKRHQSGSFVQLCSKLEAMAAARSGKGA